MHANESTAVVTSMNADAVHDPAQDLVLPEGAGFFKRMHTAYRALRILERDPANVIAGPLFNACIDIPRYAEIVRELGETEDGELLLRERPSLQGEELRLDELAALPEGTLGHATARYFEENGISPFVTTFELKNDLDFISKRYRETHDLFHIVTHYQTDVVGEMELQAFVMGNLKIRSPLMILLFATVAMLTGGMPEGGYGPKKGDIKLVPYLRRVRHAFRRGKATPALLAFPYEAHWRTSLDELRATLRLPPLAERA